MSSVGGRFAARRPARIPSSSSSSITSTSSTAMLTRLSGRRKTGASSRGRNGMIGAATPVGGPSEAPAFAGDPIGSSEAVGVGERPVGGPDGGPAFASDPIGSSEAVGVLGCEASTGGGGLRRLTSVVGAEVPVAIIIFCQRRSSWSPLLCERTWWSPRFRRQPRRRGAYCPKLPFKDLLWATKERRVGRPRSDSLCNVDHMFEPS